MVAAVVVSDLWKYLPHMTSFTRVLVAFCSCLRAWTVSDHTDVLGMCRYLRVRRGSTCHTENLSIRDAGHWGFCQKSDVEEEREK